MTLDQFCQWWLDQNITKIPPACSYDFGPVRSVVLYRAAPFQVELFTMLPGDGAVDAHRHPRVDSIEVPIAGELAFVINGKTHSAVPGSILHVGPKDWHSVDKLPYGSAFYSIQKWDDGTLPSSVGLEWEGTRESLAGIKHLKLLGKQGKWYRLKSFDEAVRRTA